MSPKIRVFIVDDSLVVRTLLLDILTEDPQIEVVGSAPNGRIALKKIPQAKPDVITLDIEMPEMDGLETLRALRAQRCGSAVIMFSSLTERGAKATFEALELGACDYVTKPARLLSPTDAAHSIGKELIPKIKLFAAQTPAKRKPPPLASAPRPTIAHRRVDVLAIGISTGGPNALAALIPALPASFPVPVVIVQHMPPVFTQYLAERLTRRAKLSVQEAKPGQALQPGEVYLAPGGEHLLLSRPIGAVKTATSNAPPENSCRPSVDVLLRSVAKVYGAHTLAVIMTGMGQDGLRGCEAVHQAGGQIIVQDQPSSVVWGMPGAVANASLAEMILPLDQLPMEIIRRVSNGRLGPAAGGASHRNLPGGR